MGETLGSPQNVTAQDYTVSFDEVPRATNYDILANNAVIGNVQGANINMAEKILNTQIQLRYDEFTNWTTNNPFLKKGEIAVTVIPAAATNTGDVIPPAIMFKVGSGEGGDASKFNSLPWASALAADVYPWAKAKTAPVIGDGKIIIKQAGVEKGSFTVNQSGSTTIELTDTKVTDTDTQYQLVLSGHTLKLQSKAKGGSWADVSGQSFTLPDNNTTYTFTSTATSGASFKVTPFGGTAQTVYIDGLGTAAFKAEGDFDAHGAAAAVLGESTDAATKNTVYGAKKAAAAAQATANDANELATSARSKANSAQTAAEQADTKADAAKTQAANALVTADAAQAAATFAKNKADQNELTISNVQKTIPTFVLSGTTLTITMPNS